MTGTVRSHSFPKSERLLKRREFLAVGSAGQRVVGRNFIIVYLAGQGSTVRLGITTSRKIGNAVVRNRIKRLVREWYRLNKSLFVPGDYSVIARSGAGRRCGFEIGRELRWALNQLQGDHG